MEEDKQKKEVNNINSELLKKFLMPNVIKAMERVQDLMVRSQPKPKE